MTTMMTAATTGPATRWPHPDSPLYALGRLVGQVDDALSYCNSAKALALIEGAGFTSARSFVETVEARTSPRWVWMSSMLGELLDTEQDCDEHGPQHVVRTSTVNPADPTTAYHLSCGCVTL